MIKHWSSEAHPSSYADKIQIYLEKGKTTSIGSLAPDFAENDVNGKSVKLYNQYKDKNFTILGVSLDQENGRDKWLKAIADDHLEWTQVSDDPPGCFYP